MDFFNESFDLCVFVVVEFVKEVLDWVVIEWLIWKIVGEDDLWICFIVDVGYI